MMKVSADRQKEAVKLIGGYLHFFVANKPKINKK
jgi:hypothetical protein